MPFSQAFDPTRSLQVAWRLLKQAPLTLLIGTLLPMFGQALIAIAVQFTFLPVFLNASNTRAGGPAVLLVLLGLVGAFGMLLFLFTCWIDAGFGRAVESVLRTGQDRSELVFSGASRFGALLATRLFALLLGLLVSLPFMAVFIALGLIERFDFPLPLRILAVTGLTLVSGAASLYVGLGLSLSSAVAVLEDVPATRAISRSWELASGNRLRLLWFYILQALVLFAGMCACLIGLLVAVPLVEAMRYEAYLALTKGSQYPQWWVGTDRFPFDEQKPEDYGSPPPPVPPPLPPQS